MEQQQTSSLEPLTVTVINFKAIQEIGYYSHDKTRNVDWQAILPRVPHKAIYPSHAINNHTFNTRTNIKNETTYLCQQP